MRLRFLFFILLCFSIKKAASGQGLHLPSNSGSIKTDTVFAKRNVEPKPVFSSVKYDYYNHLGAACKLEFKFEKTTKVPLRVRLGSLQQTDYLEQKPNAIKPER